MRPASTYILLTLVLMSSRTFAQDAPVVRFSQLTARDGLSQNMVQDIVQDRRGFMWFGTKDGLNRYDGRSFKVFRNDHADTTSLSDNNVGSLFIDTRGRLWVGTANGLNLFDPASETFVRLRPAENERPWNVRAIAEDGDRTMWAGMLDGTIVAVDDPSGNDNRHPDVRHTSWISYDLPGQDLSELYTLAFDDDGTLFAGYRGGLFQLTPTSSGRYAADKLADGPFRSSVRVGNDLWFGADGRIVKVTTSESSVKLRSLPLFGSGPAFSVWNYGVRDIAAQGDTALICATMTGLSLVDSRDGRVQHYRSDVEDPMSLSSNTLTSVWLDRSGVVWVGTAGNGLNKSGRFPALFGYLSGGYGEQRTHSVETMAEDEDGTLWFISMTNQLFRILDGSGRGEMVDHTGRPGTSYYSDLAFRPGRVMWLLEPFTVIRNDRARQRVQVSHVRDAGDNTTLNQRFVRIANDTVWIATSRSLDRLSIRSGQIESFAYPVTSVVTTLIAFDDGATFWLGTSGGLLAFDVASRRWRHAGPLPFPLSNERVRCLVRDPLDAERYLWLGTDGGGLNRLDLRDSSVTVLTTRDGLPNDVIYGILADRHGHLWMSTNNGLSAFDPSRRTFRNYNVHNGLQDNEFNTRSFTRGPSGRFYFGGINGITFFDPERIRLNQGVPAVVLTEFMIFNRVVSIHDEGSPLTRVIGETDSVVLPWNRNHFGFGFAALEFTAPSNNRFRYILEGFDENWIDNGTSNQAFYTNVPPGEYRFRVEASNNDGVWSLEGASLAVIILPPLWATWWAYALYVLAVVGTAAGIVRYLRTRAALKMQVAAAAFEKEKLEEVNRLKSRFLANISHEFRTPLALIMDPADELRRAVSRPANVRAAELIRQNSRQLLRLVNELLDLSRLEANRMPVHARPGDLVQTVRGQVELLRPMAQEKHMQLFFESGPESLRASFDMDIVEKIVRNLVVNAVKFSDAGCSVVVRLTAPFDSERIHLHVEDNGPGIPPKERERIFEGFYQTGSQDQHQGGFGIGLALVKELVSLLNGTITVQAAAESGSIFTVTLPMERIADGSSPAAEIPAEGDEEKAVRALVLIVEDNAAMAQYIQEKLSTAYTVVTVSNGTVGLERARALLPDLIISDVMMPGLSGDELCRRVKDDLLTSHIPVVLLTAKADEESALQGLESGADEYITKPFSSRVLIAKVRSILRNREKLAAKYRRSIQDPSSTVKASTREEEFLEKVHASVRAHLSDPQFGVDELAKEVFLSPSQLFRKMKSLTGLSSVKFIQKLRLQAAVRLLAEQRLQVSEVAYQVGFNDPAYFARVFKQEFGCTPQEFQPRRNSAKHS